MIKIEKIGDAEIEAAVQANDGYCPCAAVKDKDTKCMCKDFRDQPDGICHCGLYKKTIVDN